MLIGFDYEIIENVGAEVHLTTPRNPGGVISEKIYPIKAILHAPVYVFCLAFIFHAPGSGLRTPET